MTEIALDEKALGAAIAEPDDTQWHIDRMDSIVRDLWAANDIDLHMCNNTVKRNQSGLLHDIRNSWRVVRHALATAPLSQVAPANPAQVTEAMVEAACRSFAPDLFSDDVHQAHQAASPLQIEAARHPIRTRMRAALTAAIGAGGQAVAEDTETLKARAASVLCEAGALCGWPAPNCNAREGAEALFKAGLLALSQPHPANERVVEEARRRYPSQFAPSDLPQDIENWTDGALLAALSAKEAR